LAKPYRTIGGRARLGGTARGACLADGADQHVRMSILGQAGRRSRLERSSGDFSVDEARKRDHVDLGTGVLDALDDGGAVHAGHYHVNDRDLWPEIPASLDGVRPVPGFPYHPHIAAGGEEGPQSLANLRVVIDDHYADSVHTVKVGSFLDRPLCRKA
jgi:hypothetical protein